MNYIAIIGAFDRYNYGDLLFPIIIEKYLNNFYSNRYKIDYYSLSENDLSIYGGKKTKSISNLFLKIPNNSVLIISGGEVLQAKLSNMYFDLETNKLKLIIKRKLRKIIGISNYEKILKNKLGINNNFPWIFSKNDFNGSVKILYNAVGGSNLSKLTFEELKQILSKLKFTDYISVRDKKTQLNFMDVKPKLYPDSATIMSILFKKEYLEQKISNNVKSITKQFPKGYICIQCNLYSIINNDKILAKQLEMIHNKYKLGIVLLPIGIASNHDDNIALNKLKKILKVPSALPKGINIYEIMYLIANSNFFGGTSLHGNITAMSYAIPHIGFNKKITKLNQYLNTWDLDEQSESIEFNELFNKFEQLTKISNTQLLEKRDKLINLALENLNEMFKIAFDES